MRYYCSWQGVRKGLARLRMLLNSWNQIVTSRGSEVAFRHHELEVGGTFSDIDAAAAGIDTSGECVVVAGDSPEFFSGLVAAWRAGKPALLLENRTSKARPIECEIPSDTVLIKQTCGASGIERSLFFTAEQVFAEGMRNLEGLGLHPGRPGLAAISLAHSYGFGCLALPLLLAGVPLDIVSGPMPMFIHPALDRAGEEGVFLPGVPAIWKTWWQTGIAKHPAISLALSAGSPLSLELEHGVFEECGLKIHNFYGTSETGAISCDDSSMPRTSADFVGRLLPGLRADLDDENRIVIASDSLAFGADVCVSRNEFSADAYHTLDQGRVTSEGIFLTRCTGDAINVAGRKVSPHRLAEIVEGLEGVRSARVERGRSRDFERFEEIRVHLVMNRDFDKKALREQLRQKVESWEMPRQWTFEDV